MTLAICLQSKIESEAKAQRFLGLLSDIADITYSSEPDNAAYCWFQKSQHNSLDGDWICGFEVYRNEGALVETHRSSPEYRLMRKCMAEEEFYGPSILPEITFYKPFGKHGFISSDPSQPERLNHIPGAFVAISKYTAPSAELASKLAEAIDRASETFAQEPDVLSYYPIVRQDGKESTITIFERYATQLAYEKIVKQHEAIYSALQFASDHAVSTTWDRGLGHIRNVDVSSDESRSPSP